MTLALEQYRSMTEDSAADIEVYRGYIQASIRTGQKEEAYLIGKEAAQRFPEHPSAYELLGWAAIESGRKDEAKVALEKALEMSPYLPTARKLLDELDR